MDSKVAKIVRSYIITHFDVERDIDIEIIQKSVIGTCSQYYIQSSICESELFCVTFAEDGLISLKCFHLNEQNIFKDVKIGV